MRSQSFFALVAAFALFTATACSSSSKTRVDDSGSMADGSSSADAVGSIPEDMMGEELGGATADATSADAGADPFADLANDSEAQSESLVAEAEEAGESQSSEPLVADADKDSTSAAMDLAVIEDGESKKQDSSSGGELQTYTVKSGDTLMKIAFNLYGDVERWKDLQEWNRTVVKKANWLKPGMKLSYEASGDAVEAEKLGHSYTIKKGDTLANIADEVYGRKMKYKKLQRYNARLIKNPNVIFAGFTLYYDITPQEMAEAEARRKERLAAAPAIAPNAPAISGDAMGGSTATAPAASGGGWGSGNAAPTASVPSAVSPPSWGAPAPAPVTNVPAPSSVTPTAPTAPARQ